MAAERRVKAGVVGCGDISLHGYFPYVSKVFDLVATCDLIQDRAQEMARIWGAKEVYNDYDEMLAKADIEAVFVLTPMATHAQLTLKAAQAGKHFLVQKPFCTQFDEGMAVVQAARKAGVKVVVEPNYWMDPIYNKAKEIIEEGHLGTVHYILGRTERDFIPLWGGDTYYGAEGGGMLFDMGVYLISALAYLMGPAKKVTGAAKLSIPERPDRWADEVFTDFLKTYNAGDSPFAYRQETQRMVPTRNRAYDNVFTIIEWPHECLGCVVSNATSLVLPPPGPRIFMCGDKGTLAFGIPESGSPLSVGTLLKDSPYHVATPSGRGAGWYHFAPDDLPHWRYMEGSTQHLHDCIVQDVQPYPFMDWGMHVAEIMIRTFESAEQGKAFDLVTTF